MSDIARDIVEEYDALVKKYKELEKSNFQYIKALERIKQLEEQIADMNDAYKVVMDEKCADDEIHCTCVPALRQQIKQLEDERRMYLDEKATFKEQVKQLEDMLKDIKNADKRFLQLFLVLASINIIFLVLLI